MSKTPYVYYVNIQALGFSETSVEDAEMNANDLAYQAADARQQGRTFVHEDVDIQSGDPGGGGGPCMAFKWITTSLRVTSARLIRWWQERGNDDD